MDEMKFTSVDRIFTKIQRDLKGTEINEVDIIEMVGEALEFLQVAETQEEVVAFIEVKNHHADIPCGFQSVLQIARNRRYSLKVKDSCTVVEDVVEQANSCHTNPTSIEPYPIPLDCSGRPIMEEHLSYYRPYFDLKWQYQFWLESPIYHEAYTPVKLANSSFFNSIVSQENNPDIYVNCRDEYTIVGTTDKRFRFSFKEGQIALSFLKTAMDPQTGYPLIPDHVSYISAITYYIKWKIAEMLTWEGREGFTIIARDSEKLWLRYASQSKNYSKMPKTIDEYQNVLELTHNLVPNENRYYKFFGNVNRYGNR